MKLNNTKYRLLHMVQRNPRYMYRLEKKKYTESSALEKDLGVLVDKKVGR